ncbi:alpha/beta fold hydrolase [Kribbella sp. NBC_00889]|uniref:alpha/beta fold hydrolase n=1 Tax=Kribbella sp. NBC_00889 TaxID=2975974 RepID=UPI003865B702|nr:alpha/beta hydrolase [Kribbella sp. NBC_00889]
MVEIRKHVLKTDRGEILVEDSGPRNGLAVVVHPGTPGSRLLFGPGADVAAGSGLRLVSFDRPGYGSRPVVRGRTVADTAVETGMVADRLGLERFAVWGFSGGGPYALACAAMMPERVVAACVFASPAPYAPGEFDYAEGWSEAAREELERYFTDQETARANWRQDAETMLAKFSDPEGWLERWGDRAEQDVAHSREVAEYLAADVRESLGNGDQGWWDDWVSLIEPWGFDLAGIRVPVRLWHGARDRHMPLVHGHRIAKLVPGIEACFPDEDHTTIEDDHRIDAYEWLTSRK